MSSGEAFAVVAAAPEWSSIDFVSDLHLSADTPRTYAAFADYLQGTAASAIFILGDLFEAWVGDDAANEGFEAEATQLLRQAATRRPISFLHGNRDFLVGDDWFSATGVRRLGDPVRLDAFGQRVLLTHGDALCLGDVDYQAFRALVRGAAWQREFLARPLEERRQTARAIRAESQRRKAERRPEEWADVDPPMTLDWLRAAGADVLVHGHTHRPGSAPIGPSNAAPLRHVLSDWDLDDDEAARAEVLRLGRRGFTRMSPRTAGSPC